MNNVRDEISKNLLYYRKKNGLTQKQLAEKLGVKNSAVSNWEKGLNSINIDTLHTVCKVFNVSINDMFGSFSNANKTTKSPPANSADGQLVELFKLLSDDNKEKITELLRMYIANQED